MADVYYRQLYLFVLFIHCLIVLRVQNRVKSETNVYNKQAERQRETMCIIITQYIYTL